MWCPSLAATDAQERLQTGKDARVFCGLSRGLGLCALGGMSSMEMADLAAGAGTEGRELLAVRN